MKSLRFNFLEIYEIQYITMLIANIVILFFTDRKLAWVFIVVLATHIFFTVIISNGLNKFIQEDRKYTKFFINEAKVNLIGVSSIFISGLCLEYMHNIGLPELSIKSEVIILVVYILTCIIGGMRYYDVRTSCNSGWSTATKEVKVNNIKDNCLNGRYCKIFMDKETDVKFEVGKRYKITYLSGTLGLYVIEAKEVEASRIKITISDYKDSNN